MAAVENRLEQLFYVALGSALVAKEKFEKNSEEIKEAADKAEQTARSFFEDMAERGEQEKDVFRNMLKDVIKDVVDDLNLATKEDIEKLRRDLGH